MEKMKNNVVGVLVLTFLMLFGVGSTSFATTTLNINSTGLVVNAQSPIVFPGGIHAVGGIPGADVSSPIPLTSLPTNSIVINATNIISLLEGIALPDTSGTNVFINCTNVNSGLTYFWTYSTANNTTIYPTNTFVGARFDLAILATGNISVAMPTNWAYFKVTNGLTLQGQFWTFPLANGQFADITWVTNNYNQYADWHIWGTNSTGGGGGSSGGGNGPFTNAFNFGNATGTNWSGMNINGLFLTNNVNTNAFTISDQGTFNNFNNSGFTEDMMSWLYNGVLVDYWTGGGGLVLAGTGGIDTGQVYAGSYFANAGSIRFGVGDGYAVILGANGDARYSNYSNGKSTLELDGLGTDGGGDLLVTGKGILNQGIILPMMTVTNWSWSNIPPAPSWGSGTNWWVGTFTNGLIYAIATNNTSGGYYYQKLTSSITTTP